MDLSVSATRSRTGLIRFRFSGVAAQAIGIDRMNIISFRLRILQSIKSPSMTIELGKAKLSETHSANRHDLGAACLFEDKATVARPFENVEVIDRVGSGDAFVAGFIDSVLEQNGMQSALDCGTAHGVLAMTTPGDISMATSAEVFRLMKNANATPFTEGVLDHLLSFFFLGDQGFRFSIPTDTRCIFFF